MADRLQEKLKKLEGLPWQGGLWVVGASFLIATLVNTVVAKSLFPKSIVTKNRMDPKSLSIPNISASLSPTAVDNILKRNIFNAEGTTGEGEEKPAEPQEGVDETKAVKSTLNVRLLGTIYGGDPFSGAAIVENTSNRSTNTFMVGDVLTQNAVIKEVLREKIILDNNGRLEFVEVEKTKLVRSRRSRKKKSASVRPGVAPIANTPPPQKYSEEGFERDGTKMEMTGEYRKKLLTTDFTKVLQDAKATPNMVDGELRGFKLTRIRKDSIYEKSGLQNDDIVEEINGVSLNDTSQAIRLLQSLRNESSIEIRINRGGSSMRFDLSIQ